MRSKIDTTETITTDGGMTFTIKSVRASQGSEPLINHITVNGHALSPGQVIQIADIIRKKDDTLKSRVCIEHGDYRFVNDAVGQDIPATCPYCRNEAAARRPRRAGSDAEGV
jgi:hypothetical protein